MKQYLKVYDENNGIQTKFQLNLIINDLCLSFPSC